LEEGKIKEWHKNHPIKGRDDTFLKLKLIKKIADFVYLQPNRKAFQREICRRFFQKKTIEDLEELRPWLRVNYGIECLKGKRKNQVIYVGMMKDSRGRFFRVGIPKNY
jgi:hypothetical protein